LGFSKALIPIPMLLPEHGLLFIIIGKEGHGKS
jgi:hypothetical protein